MKIKITLIAIMLVVLLAACEQTEEIIYEEVDQTDMGLFIKQAEGRIGDVMPFYDGDKWQIFYLHDTPPRPGFHPWYRFSTENFYEFEDHGEVIPVVHDTQDPELALGTGSVYKKDDTYYAFYTSHNGRLDPVEQMMLSISTDNMETWTKQPEFTLNPYDYGFNPRDFRDPHVVFIPEYGKYYMLFTTRVGYTGAIGYLVSDDLLNWEKQGDGIFFLNNNQTGTDDITSNLECPTLVYFNGYWYLTFSDQWPTRVTHYLYTDDLSQGFRRPTINALDGAGLYAGKIDTDGERLLLMGWVSYDFNRLDENGNGEFAWGGNFIAHELRQQPNGLLYVDMIDELDEKISRPQLLEITQTNISGATPSNINFTPNGQYQYAALNNLEGINKITGTLTINEVTDSFGIFFDFEDNQSAFHYDLSPSDRRMSFYRGSFTQRNIANRYTYNDFFVTSSRLNFTLLFEEGIDADGTIVTLYIDGQMALTGRMFLRYDMNFGFYGLNSDVQISQLKLFK